MFKIKEYLLQEEASDYAKAGDKALYRFNCSLGENPFGMSESVRQAWPLMDPAELSGYPESRVLLDDLISYLPTGGELSREHLTLGNGSVDLLFMASRMFTREGGSVLGYFPQFTAFVNDVENQGALYKACSLKKEHNYRFSPEDLLAFAKEDDYDLIYIDNPNNPSGQVIPLLDIEQIVSYGEQHNTAVFVDEAYGDYMDKDNSAVTLVPRFSNLLVFRSFSKGFGLAGLRGGYLVSDPEIIRCYTRLSSPYDFNGPARVLASVALRDTEFLEHCRAAVSYNKKRLMESLSRFRIAETSTHIPISLLYVEDPACDLQEYLHSYQIHTISGKNFPGLGKNFVRMNLHRDFDKLLEVLIQADENWRPRNV